jgi:hypothetical protein
MTNPASVRAFIETWERNQLNETATAKEHFVALCHLLGLKSPNEADPLGDF